MLLFSIIVGLIGGFGAVGFRYLIDFFQFIFYGSADELVDVVETVSWYRRIAIPAIGGLIIGPVVYFFAREAKGHGVPEVMEAVALRNGVIRKRIVVIKTFASAVCIGSGGSVGREGPIVQIGSAAGSAFGQFFKTSGNRMKLLVGCGAAAGIAATFNAPIAGAMFAFEIILAEYGISIFSPVIISAVTATAVSRHFLGDVPAFVVPTYELISTWELPMYAVLGFFSAFVGLLFITILYKAEDLFEAVKFPEYLKAVFGGLILGASGLLFPQVLGVGYGSINLALEGNLSWSLMVILCLVKIFATSITLGSGGSGGIFAPSLFMGSMAGGFFGSIVHKLFPAITAPAGAYSMVGMGAVVASTTQGPLSAILILMEMTSDYKIILPLMISCILSSMVANRLSKGSIYTIKLMKRGVNLSAGKEVSILSSLAVRDVMNPDVETIPEGLKLEQLAERISKSKHMSFPVVNDQGKLTGILSYIDYHNAFGDENLKHLVVAKDLATHNVEVVSVDDNLLHALEKITKGDFSILPVVASDDPTKLLGAITRRDMMDAYNAVVLKRSLADKLGGAA